MAEKTAVAELKLSDVKLSQLPRWLASCSFTPRAIGQALVRGKERYATKYIYVRKTTVAPLGQFVAMCIILSYIWRYDTEKHHRLRKHHW